MEEYLASRVAKLERAVRRWRLAAISFGILFLCSLACGGTCTTLLLMNQPGRREVEILRAQEAEARMQAERARQALQQEEARRKAEAKDVP